ncbi:MAG: MATE family efflux transporter [Pseudomonadota bacterium]
MATQKPPPGAPATPPTENAPPPANNADAALLTEGPVRVHLVAMTVPMIWGILSIILFNAVDVFFIAKLGTEPLAAIAFCYPVILTVGALGIGLGVGTASVVSRAVGEGDNDTICRLSTHALSLSLVIVTAVTIVGLLTIRPLFTALGAGPEALVEIEKFMRIWYLGSPLLVVPMIANSIIRARGDAKFPSYVMIAAAAVNAILDPLFIFGLGPFPRLEIEGAAVASVIARAFALFASIAILVFRERLIRFSGATWATVLAAWKSVLKIAGPAALAQMLNPILTAVLTAFVAQYGAAAVAGYGVAGRIESIFLTVLFAVSMGLSPIVGQNWGRQRIDRVKEATALAFMFCLAYGALLAVVLPFIGGPMASIFDPSTEVVATAALYLSLAPLGYAGHGIALAAASSFNGSGKPLHATIVAAGRALMLVIPCTALGSYFFGMTGLFAGVALGNMAAGLSTYLYFRQRCNLHLRAVPQPTAAMAEHYH